MDQVQPRAARLKCVEAMTQLVQEMVDAPVGQHRMSCFHGPSGSGKTFATSVCEMMFGAIVVEVIENTSKMDVLTHITETYGITSRKNVSDQIRSIARFLEREGCPLIFDDAQYLIKRGMIGITRDIYNLTGGLVPVVLVGEPKLYEHLRATENIYNRVSATTCAS